MRAHFTKSLLGSMCLLVFTWCQNLPYAQTVILQEVDGSGLSGKVVLSYEGDEIWVDIPARPQWHDTLVGHIHRGRCGNPGELVMSLAGPFTHAPTQRFGEGGYAIELHAKAADSDGPVVACGDF